MLLSMGDLVHLKPCCGGRAFLALFDLVLAFFVLFFLFFFLSLPCMFWFLRLASASVSPSVSSRVRLSCDHS